MIKMTYLRNLGLIIILAIVFCKSLYQLLFGGSGGAALILLIASILIVISEIMKGRISFDKDILLYLWLIVFLFTLRNNYDIHYGNSLSVIQLIVGAILIICLRSDSSWCYNIVKYIKKYTMFMLITGLILLIFRSILKNYIVPLFYLNLSSDYYSESLISQINNGYMTGLTSHYSLMGIYMSIGLCFYAGVMFNNEKKIKKTSIIGFLSMLIGVLLTGKRSALIFPLMAIIIVYICFFKSSQIRRVVNYLIYILLIVLSVCGTIVLFPNMGGTISRIIGILGSGDINEITNKRYVMLWLPAIKLFNEEPLFGIGWGNFKYSFTKYYSFTANQNNTHNVYLQLLCETGVVGFVIVLGTILLTLIQTLRTLNNWKLGRQELNNSKLQVLGISLTMQIYFLLYSITGNPLYDIQSFIPYIISVAMSMSTIYTIRKENR